MKIIETKNEKELLTGNLRPIISGAVSFENVNFSYPQRPDVTVLKSITLESKANQTIALVGSSGAGKSTIASLLLRYFEINAGKLTFGVTSPYSPLTSGYGTQETIITSNMYSKPSMANFGVNTWLAEFNEEQYLFDKRYKPPALQYMPNYPERYSLTGEFIEDGPFASNSFIPNN